MFYDCSGLTSLICLATSISASNCLKEWVKNVSLTGIFYKADGMTGWTQYGNSAVPYDSNNPWTIVSLPGGYGGFVQPGDEVEI